MTGVPLTDKILWLERYYLIRGCSFATQSDEVALRVNAIHPFLEQIIFDRGDSGRCWREKGIAVSFTAKCQLRPLGRAKTLVIFFTIIREISHNWINPIIKSFNQSVWYWRTISNQVWWYWTPIPFGCEEA